MMDLIADTEANRKSIDIDDIVGFSAAQKRAEQRLKAGDQSEETKCYANRVFINHIDDYHGKHIAWFLSEKAYGALAFAAAGEGEEEEEEEEEEKAGDDVGDEHKSTKKDAFDPDLKYEIIGTMKDTDLTPPEDITKIVNETDDNFTTQIMQCGHIIYDISQDRKEIPKALETINRIVNELENFEKEQPRAFERLKDKRYFYLISTILTWAKTKKIGEPFSERQYKKRKPHPNFKEHLDLEKEIIAIGKKYPEKLSTIVIASGLTYGGEEQDLHFLFKLAWKNEAGMPIFYPPNNVIPLVNIKDLTTILYTLMETPQTKRRYFLAVESPPSKQKQIVKALSKTLGSGVERIVSEEEAFLFHEMTQDTFDKLRVNLEMEPQFLSDLGVEFSSEMNFVDNISSIIEEYKKSRGLLPLKIIVHGPPAVGKTRIAKRLCEHYDLHYISIKTLVQDVIDGLRDKISKAKVKALEMERKQLEKEQKGGEEVEAVEEEEAEEEEEEEGNNIEELQEQLNELKQAMEDNDGRLPDEYVVRFLKEKLASNPFQNQGYVLDGYPKTLALANQVFGTGSTEEEEEAEDEEGNQEDNAAKKILPEFVVSLTATDEFLISRLMTLTEMEIQGTHYTEENMLRRLEEFRSYNTDDTSPLDFFDENEIHPLVIDVMEDRSETMDLVFGILLDRIGKPRGYGLTREELLAIREEKIRWLLETEREKQKQQQESDIRAIIQREENMEKWVSLLEMLQHEEEKILAAQGEPIRSYLMKFVFPTLTRGLIEVARIKPEDPVDFLAEYLFKENPEGKMFDPAYTSCAEELYKAILQLKHCLNFGISFE